MDKGKRQKKTLIHTTAALIALVVVLLLTLPVWADEMLMSRAGFAYWLLEKTLPGQRRLESMEEKTESLEALLADWKDRSLRRIYLWPEAPTIEYYAPGGIHAGSANLDVPPRIMDGRTMVPLRFIGEALGADVAWDAEKRQVAYLHGDRQILLTVGNPMVIAGDKTVEIDTPPVIIDDRTMVPVRFISQWLGAIVKWDAQEKRVEIWYY